MLLGVRRGEKPLGCVLMGRRTTLERQLHSDQMTPESIKARQLLALGRRESK